MTDFIENFEGQNKLYGKSLTALVYDAIINLHLANKEEITNSTIRRHIMSRKIESEIPVNDRKRLYERIIKTTNSLIKAGLITAEEKRNSKKMPYKVFTLNPQ